MRKRDRIVFISNLSEYKNRIADEESRRSIHCISLLSDLNKTIHKMQFNHDLYSMKSGQSCVILIYKKKKKKKMTKLCIDIWPSTTQWRLLTVFRKKAIENFSHNIYIFKNDCRLLNPFFFHSEQQALHRIIYLSMCTLPQKVHLNF